jgi:putative ABC transport system permease protein
MKFKKALGLAWSTLVHSKLRSWLTIIGIIIGIAAVVSIISVSQGAKISLESQLNSLGTNIITISPGAARATGTGATFLSRGGGGGGFGGSSGSYNLVSTSSTQKNLTQSDISVLGTVPNIQYVMGTYSGRTDLSYLTKTASISVEGVDPTLWQQFTTTALAEGRYLTEGDTNSIVVGYNVANTVFSGISVNQQVLINGTIFRIVGILKQSGGSDDSNVFMSLSESRIILGDQNGIDFKSILVKISDTSQTNQTVTDITNTLMMERGILQQNNIDFSVTSPLALQARVTSSLNSISLFLAAIAAISLLVGAIGISNTMFTSVLEKTKEIGIMKAIGAKNKDILMIFLLKSGMLGLVGGIGGVILGILGSLLIGQLGGISLGIGRGGALTSYINPWLVIGAFAASIFIGMVAGAIPAYRASKLSPIEALRYE